jgi:transcriptional regulator with GAF, ATPase, and Fis domain/CHASE2 domain-containing sensor protein
MMNLLRSKELGVGAVAALLVALLSLAMPGPFHELEKGVLKAKYRARGVRPADSSVVVVYFDNNDIAALGDIPIQRSYYALLIHALRDVGVSSIGVDIGLGGVDPDHPEYDQLLSTVVGVSGNVVLSGYFRALQDDSLGLEPEQNNPFLDRFSMALRKPVGTRWGSGLETPFAALLGSASGFGHTNYIDANTVPLIIQMRGGRAYPSFGYALYQIRLRANRAEEPHISYPAAPNGDVMLNYPGDFSVFRRIPAVEFLKAYDDVKAGRIASLPFGDLRGTTVIVGIVAEGRSAFLETPYSSQFPSIGIHATLIDNILHETLLRRSSPLRDAFAAFVIGLCAALLLTMRKETLGLAGVAVLVAVFVGLAFGLFAWASYSLAVSPTVASALVVALVMFWYKHRLASDRVDEVVRQHEGVAGLLREKEAALAKLERELSESIHRHSEAKTAHLAEEIRQYKTEVERLKIIAEDLRPAQRSDAAPARTRASYNGIFYHAGGPMGPVVELVKKVADSNATVLILGESGTGKELIAKAIHNESPRKAKPFIAVNCGALAETLLESELFGFERGAFTGAVKEKQGRFELADGGTIFLDEIGEISEAFQVKLLRVLQDGTFERVGGTGTRHVDVRIIAATNRDLKAAVAQKKFREDLYYRLNVFAVSLPPLRERGEDLRMLVEHFAETESRGLRCSETAMEAMLRYPWKGNIRELQSIIKRAALLARSEGRSIIQVKDLGSDLTSAPAGSSDLEEQIIKLMREKEFSRSAISETADDLGGLNRGTVAEYVRGWVFKTFAESMWSIPATVDAVAGTRDTTVRNRVQKKVNEYLANARQYVDPAKTLDEVQALSKPKYKNLPQRYHKYLDDVIASAYKGHWEVDEEWNRTPGDTTQE